MSDQKNVAEVFGDYFSTMANEIGGQYVLQLDEEDFNTHEAWKQFTILITVFTLNSPR